MNRERGLTVVELMVTLAIAAVLLGVALPAFNTFVDQRRLTTQVNDFLLAVQFARSEATKRGANVSVIAVNAGDNADEWGPGWCVVVGSPANCPAATDVANLTRFDATDPNTFSGLGALDGVDRLTFNSRGVLVGAVGGTLNLCGAAGSNGRTVALAATGRASSGDLVCP